MENAIWLSKARGYLELGMYEEAMAEIHSLPDDLQYGEKTRELLIVMDLERLRYDDALRHSIELSRFYPENEAGFLQGAYCLHELARTAEAIEHLQSGPQSLRDEPVYFYNLACYELALGKEQTAMTWLKQAFVMDRRYRQRALKDPDLSTVRDLILEDAI